MVQCKKKRRVRATKMTRRTVDRTLNQTLAVRQMSIVKVRKMMIRIQQRTTNKSQSNFRMILRSSLDSCVVNLRTLS